MRPVILSETVALLNGDSRALELGEGAIDAVVCDPPYELGFMNKRWDASGIAYDVGLWRAVLRALKPGGHLLAFGGSRTYHRMACAIEDAGFEIRDSLHWVYGSGFPKSLNLGKQIDKKKGAKRQVLGPNPNARPSERAAGQATGHAGNAYSPTSHDPFLTAPGSPEAARWEGWGTALKPAHEPIVLARKPFKGTVTNNILRHGTGALNIHACKVGDEARFNPPAGNTGETPASLAPVNVTGYEGATAVGRWPANLILSHLEDCEPVGVRLAPRAVYHNVDAAYDRDETVYAGGWRKQRAGEVVSTLEEEFVCAPGCPVAELGEPARFFYCAKPSNRERDYGCEGLPKKSRAEATEREEGSAGSQNPRAGAGSRDGRANYHPTVKPVELMRYLCRLVTPPSGVVLDPFTGSGTTGIAAVLEGFRFVGIEQSPEYAEIARARITRALEETCTRK